MHNTQTGTCYLIDPDCLGCCIRRELEKGAGNSWGFQTASERRQTHQAGSLPSGVASRKAGLASTMPAVESKLYDESAAAQQAFKREALSRRLHNKEFNAKQSIRKRQQEFDVAVKARLAQDAAMSSKTSSSGRSQVGAKRAQQLPELTATPSSGGGLSGPRARKLQAFVRHPRPPQLPTPPRQLSRIPDDLLLPDINGTGGKQRSYASDSMANLLIDDEASQQATSGIGTVGSQASLLPELVSQRSSMRRMTQVDAQD